MSIHIIVAAPTSGGAGRSASHALTHAALAQNLAATLFEVRPEDRDRLSLIRPVVTGSEEAAKAIAERRRPDEVIAYVERPSEDVLRHLLPLADTVMVVGDRTRNLDHAADLYEMVAELGIIGASGLVLLPWLLPSGWPCTRNPDVRLRGWRAQLERRTVAGRLRCLPLVFPWSDLGSLVRANKERIEAIGTSLLKHLTAIASGRAPDRPAAGLAGGDPWPDLLPPAPVVRLSGIRPRLIAPQGA
jgi:hypothetical protein